MGKKTKEIKPASEQNKTQKLEDTKRQPIGIYKDHPRGAK
jgi:hypothetical protein